MNAHPAPDRRAHPRYLCWVEALATSKETAPQPARLLNLSASGASVALLQPLPPGTELRLTLLQGERRPSVVAASVNRIVRTRTGWEAGCTFKSPLTAEQLAKLLQAIEVG